MNDRKEFRENTEGIHVMYGEFTLCGDSFDIDITEDIPELKFKVANRRVVTCPKCAAIIRFCKRIAIEAQP